MRLSEYLRVNSITIPAFAAKLEVSVQAVHRYIAGDRAPRPPVMEKIRELTSGAVQPNDFHASVIEARSKSGNTAAGLRA